MSCLAENGRVARIAGYDGVRVLLGLLLLTAAGFKGYQLATEPTLEADLLTSRWFLVGVVEFELFFGLWLLAGLLCRPTWLGSLGCFGLFAWVSRGGPDSSSIRAAKPQAATGHAPAPPVPDGTPIARLSVPPACDKQPYVGFLVLVWIASASFAQAEGITVGQFRSEAPQAWNKLKVGILEGFNVELNTTWGDLIRHPDGVGPSARDGGESRCSLCVLGFNELIQRDFIKGGRKGLRIEAVNDRYAFDVIKRQAEQTGWEVWNINHNPASMKSEEHGVLLGNTIVFYGIMVEGDWLENLLKSPGFEVVSGDNVASDNSKREFKVTFRSQHAVDNANTILGGTMWFSPDNFWVLNRYDVEIKSTTKGRGQAEFQYQDLAGYPFLKEATIDYSFEGDLPIRYHYEFGKVSRCNDDVSAFQLSAFGIPEPAGLDATMSASARGWWIAFSLIGIVFCSLALVLRGYARRCAT